MAAGGARSASAFALAFMATFVLALILAFLSPWESVLTFLLGNGEKGRILSQSGVIPFGAFGWAFACAHRDLRRRFTFHRSGLKAGVYCARRGAGTDRAVVDEDGSVNGGPGCMPIGRGRSGGGVRSPDGSKMILEEAPSGGYGRLHRPRWFLFTHTADHMSY